MKKKTKTKVVSLRPALTGSTTYSNAELAEFDGLIVHKISQIDEAIAIAKSQLQDIASEKSPDWVDNASANTEEETVKNFLSRQYVLRIAFENARARITNKTYGMCIVTGRTISKERLYAVPQTTRSIEAKESLKQQQR